MRFVIACLCVGLASWMSYGVYTGTFSTEGGGSSKTQAVKTAVARMSENYGTDQTALYLLIGGAVLAFFVIVLGPREDA